MGQVASRQKGTGLAVLTDYLDLEYLQELQATFRAAAGAELQIWCARCGPICPQDACGARDETAGRHDGPPSEAAILIDNQVAGCVRLPADQKVDDRTAGFLRLTADVLARLCQQQSLLRTRVAELGTLYRLTAEFTDQKDLQRLLDMVVATVVSALNVKTCAIRLLSADGSELLIRAVTNLSARYLSKGPILLSRSVIDREVLDTGQPVYIADERTDPRVLYPEEARREGIVSALCAPMIYKGRPEGVLRVYTAELHEFDWFEQSLIRAIAANAAAAIANARLYQEAVRGANIQRQLRLAGEVQRRMIPAEPPDVPGFDISAIYVPCFELGGDFYDFIKLGGDNIGIAVCDVVGKGVRASLLMASLRAALRAHATAVYDMSDVLARLNADLCSDSLASDFATLFYGVLDVPARRLTYANAGHIPPMLVRDGRVRHLSTGGGVIGINEEARFPHDSLVCLSGDVIFAFTDGLSEVLNFNDEAFGRHRVERALLAAVAGDHDAGSIARQVLWEMRRFAGLQKRFDDLTIITIKTL